MGYGIEGIEGAGGERHIRLESEVIATNVVAKSESDSLVCEEGHNIVRLVGDAVVDGGMDSGDGEEEHQAYE